MADPGCLEGSSNASTWYFGNARRYSRGFMWPHRKCPKPPPLTPLDFTRSPGSKPIPFTHDSFHKPRIWSFCRIPDLQNRMGRLECQSRGLYPSWPSASTSSKLQENSCPLSSHSVASAAGRGGFLLDPRNQALARRSGIAKLGRRHLDHPWELTCKLRNKSEYQTWGWCLKSEPCV